MSDKRKRTAGKMPVSAHPAFPVIVALWFAGLLGFGTLVLPPALIERISEATGLSAYFVIAQPPFAITARIAIALGAGFAGILTGLVIARTIAHAHSERPAARRPATDVSGEEPGAAIVKRPISAHDELFEGGLDADGEVGADNAGFASTPGRGYRPDDRDTAPAGDIAVDSETDPADVSADCEVLELGAMEELAGENPVGAWDFEPPCEVPGPVDGAEFERQDSHLSGASPVAAAVPEETFLPSTAAPAETQSAAGIDVAGNVAIAALVDRFARALQRHRGGSSGQDEQTARTTAEAGEEAAADLATADWSRAGPDAAETWAPAPAEPEKSVIVPHALREIDFECDELDGEDDDGVPALDLALSLAMSARPSGHADVRPAGVEATAVAQVEEDDEETGEDEAGKNYPSLLTMKSTFGIQREPVHFSDGAAAGADREDCQDSDDVIEPVSAFPARKATNGDSERALRDALEKLQRMSGAA